MVRNERKLLIVIIAICLNLGFNNISFAIEDTPVTPYIQNRDTSSKYPNFEDEFTGQDKHEKFNRKLFVFNLKLNKFVLRPINTLWASILPQYGMNRLQSAYDNINTPLRIFSCLFQKDFKASKIETARFFTNMTIGVAGFYDPAKKFFHLEPTTEDMGQVLAHCNVKRGNYWVLPMVQGNTRDLFGQLLDCPFRPTSYIPFATTAFYINSSTGSQPGIKRLDDANADPYEVARQFHGLDRYIKNMNLDRKNVFDKTLASQNIINISNISANLDSKNNLKADVELVGYNPQGPLIDSMRSALFDNEKVDSSMWSEMSAWNRTFKKRLKVSSVNLDISHPNYKYRYILQKDKNAPLAIIYPAIGECIWGDKAVREAHILYDEGYSVVILGSTFQWEFVQSMPGNYKPGLPAQDAQNLRMLTAKIINNIETKKNRKFEKKIVVGNSFGAMATLFVASQEEEAKASGNPTLGISKYIAINPPIDTMYALKQLDIHAQNWKNNPEDIKLRTAITARKVMDVGANTDYKNGRYSNLSLPFNNDEAELVISYVMKQKLSDVVFAIEKGSRSKKCDDIYEAVNNMSFYDYAQKYLNKNNKQFEQAQEQLNYGASLRSISNFLQKNNNYKIYHTLDDYYTTPEQLSWLKEQGNEKVILYSNGSHLGFLYRKEFLEQFKKDISIQSE